MATLGLMECLRDDITDILKVHEALQYVYNEGEEFWDVAACRKWNRNSNNHYHYEYACFQLLCMAPKIQ
jgi:hypothetical protein